MPQFVQWLNREDSSIIILTLVEEENKLLCTDTMAKMWYKAPSTNDAFTLSIKVHAEPNSAGDERVIRHVLC